MRGFGAILAKTHAPICCAGAAFLYCWSFLLGQADVMAGGKNVGNIIAPLILALFWRQLEPLGRKRITAVLLAVVGCVGSLSVIEGVLPAVGVLLTSLVQAALLLLWCDVYGRLPVEKAVFSFAMMQLGALALWGVMLLLPDQTYAGLSLVMPFASVSAMNAACRAVDASPCSLHAPRNERPALGRDLSFRFIIAAFACAFAYGLNQMHSDVFWNIISYGASGLVLMVGLLLFSAKFSIHSILNIAFPLVIAGLVMSSALGFAIPGFSVFSVNVGYALMTAVFTILLADRSFRFGISAIWSAGIVRAVLMAGVFLGSNTEYMMMALPSVQHAMPQVLYVATIIAVLVAVIAWIQDGDHERIAKEAFSTQGADAVGPNAAEYRGTQGAEAGQDVGAVKREIFRRCDELKDEFHLSNREYDVLKLLALGWSAPRIEAELVISNSTVKTHVRHIYTKLGVHSRDELKILIGVDAL